MTVVRFAHSDTVAPSPQPTASGNVAVAGFGDMPRSGPPRVRSSDTAPLSPARSALAQHQTNLAALAAEVERVSRPVNRLRDQLAQAQDELAHAEANLAAIDGGHAAALAQAARDGTSAPTLSPSSVGAEEALQRARRSCNSLRQALAEVTEDQQHANANLAMAQQRFDPLVLACLVEDYNKSAWAYAEARGRFFDAEAEVLGLLECIGQHGRDLEQKTPGSGIPWLRQLEALRNPDGRPPAREFGPHDIGVAAARWTSVIGKLAHDPGASF
jgi:hypothetical protein